jgi:hypothetical protein
MYLEKRIFLYFAHQVLTVLMLLSPGTSRSVKTGTSLDVTLAASTYRQKIVGYRLHANRVHA